MKVIIQDQQVEVDGYVRGYKYYKIYYDADTLKVLDAESIGEISTIRDDTVYKELPKFNDKLNYITKEA